MHRTTILMLVAAAVSAIDSPASGVTVTAVGSDGSESLLALNWQATGELFTAVAAAPGAGTSLRIQLGRAGLDSGTWAAILGGYRLIHANSTRLVVSRQPLGISRVADLWAMTQPGADACSNGACLTWAVSEGNETGDMTFSIDPSGAPVVLTASIQVLGLPSDLNLDSTVNVTDLTLLLQEFPGHGGGPIEPIPCIQEIGGGGDQLRANPDINRDGQVDVGDLVDLLLDLGETASGG